jgi:2-phosphosulfolactate phosphatase
MGNGGVRPAAEDELCAEYIRALLLGEEIPDFDERVQHLRIQGGEHFFDPERQEIFPEADFWRCIEYDKFDFVVRIERDESGLTARKLER